MSSSTKSVLEELDYAIAEFQGAAGRELSESDSASLAAALDLRDFLQQNSDLPLEEIA